MLLHLNSNNKMLLILVLVFLIGLYFYIAEEGLKMLGYVQLIQKYLHIMCSSVTLINLARNFNVICLEQLLPTVSASCDTF